MLIINERRSVFLLLLLLLTTLTLPFRFARIGQAADPCSIPSFSGPTNISLSAPRAILVDDFNEDGKLDLAVANKFSSGPISILLGNGSGAFSVPTSVSGVREPVSLASGDLNNDGNVDAEYNRSFVLGQYFGYLRRNPDIPGFIFWLGQVNGAPLRDVPKQHAMVCSFITSGEFQFRFGPVASRNNNECPQ